MSKPSDIAWAARLAMLRRRAFAYYPERAILAEIEALAPVASDALALDEIAAIIERHELYF